MRAVNRGDRETSFARFVGEAITPVTATSDTARMAAGGPGLPGAFTWRGGTITVIGVLRTWRETVPCRHGSHERYVRKHWFDIETSPYGRIRIYFDRQPRRGRTRARWWLFSMGGPTGFWPANVDIPCEVWKN